LLSTHTSNSKFPVLYSRAVSREEKSVKMPRLLSSIIGRNKADVESPEMMKNAQSQASYAEEEDEMIGVEVNLNDFSWLVSSQKTFQTTPPTKTKIMPSQTSPHTTPEETAYATKQVHSLRTIECRTSVRSIEDMASVSCLSFEEEEQRDPQTDDQSRRIEGATIEEEEAIVKLNVDKQIELARTASSKSRSSSPSSETSQRHSISSESDQDHIDQSQQYALLPNTVKSDPGSDPVKWVDSHLPRNINYLTKDVMTVASHRATISHQVHRGDWTWAMAWSPDGKRLAIASENNSLAILDCSGVVWKLIHDGSCYINKKAANLSKRQCSVRAVAWNESYIALGGIGDCVHILDGESYELIHTIQGTGFVGALCWKKNTNVLAIGTREDVCLVTEIKQPPLHADALCHAPPKCLERSSWANAVQFSLDGSMLAVGDTNGFVTIYDATTLDMTILTELPFEEAILTLTWSPDSSWLYLGGEDYACVVVSARTWEGELVVERDRWVQSAACGHKSSLVALSGGAGEISILDAQADWFIKMNIPFTGPVVLATEWHPSDQCLAIGGQDEHIQVVETNSRSHVKGGRATFERPIISLDCSPDCSMLAVGIDGGIVTFLDITARGSDLKVLNETVIAADAGNNACVDVVRWSSDGQIVAVSGGDTVVFLSVSTNHASNHGDKTKIPKIAVLEVLRGQRGVQDIAFSPNSRMVCVTGFTSKIYQIKGNSIRCVRQFKKPNLHSVSWSPDGSLLSLTGRRLPVYIYRSADIESSNKWSPFMTVDGGGFVTSLAWGPSAAQGEYQYIVLSSESKSVTIMEINCEKRIWQSVISLPQFHIVQAMDWSPNGMLAIALSNGTSTISDLSHLKAGVSATNMNVNSRPHGASCITEIRRQADNNCMSALRWLHGGKGGRGNTIVVAGTDGILEILDLADCSSQNDGDTTDGCSVSTIQS
jgi:WD40 repeat protein